MKISDTQDQNVQFVLMITLELVSTNVQNVLMRMKIS